MIACGTNIQIGLIGIRSVQRAKNSRPDQNGSHNTPRQSCSGCFSFQWFISSWILPYTELAIRGSMPNMAKILIRRAMLGFRATLSSLKPRSQSLASWRAGMKPSPSVCGTISTRLELLTGTVIMVKVMELSCSIVLHSLASIGGVLLLVVFSQNGGRRLKTTRFLLRI